MSVSIGGTIQQRRKQLKVTQQHLSTLAEVSVNTLYKIERDEGNPTLTVLTKIATILGMELKLEVKQIS